MCASENSGGGGVGGGGISGKLNTIVENSVQCHISSLLQEQQSNGSRRPESQCLAARENNTYSICRPFLSLSSHSLAHTLSPSLSLSRTHTQAHTVAINQSSISQLTYEYYLSFIVTYSPYCYIVPPCKIRTNANS